ncbi:hypothetical protein CRG98_015831 [Punica granatum]|uniref:Reverse transcriptase domain-containing protein n=1 Tax=Punica granatum TaxID=22663 RepID=A0A2I0K5G0_PUNGR|nr:hypothetical protein CRG98_015831 [Punica granatum]
MTVSQRKVNSKYQMRPCSTKRVDPRLFSENDHHSHLRRSVRSRELLTLPQNSIGRHRGDVQPDWCQMGPKFQTCSVFRDLCKAVRVDPITLGPNDHHSHLRGSVRSQEPPTLPQNSIGSLRGNVRPDLCQSVTTPSHASPREGGHSQVARSKSARCGPRRESTFGSVHLAGFRYVRNRPKHYNSSLGCQGWSIVHAYPPFVKKSNDKWRICVDYSDLNKFYPKDTYSLPRINQLVDFTTSNELLMFVNAYSGYNQIIMHPLDEEHTTFYTDNGVCCYKVNAFRTEEC